MKKSITTTLLLCMTAVFLTSGHFAGSTARLLLSAAGAITATAALISALPRNKGGKKD